jgi:large subunit ribosomal protein L25
MGMSINAETRNDQGKGASRRLRRDEKVPAIVYGAGKDPINVTVSIHEITHLLENEEAFTSVLDLNVEKKQRVGYCKRPSASSGQKHNYTC